MLKLLTKRLKQMGCRTLLPVLLVSAIYNPAHAQNGAPCYQPVTGADKTISAVQGGLICVNCNMITNPRSITDADQNNYATIGNLASIAAGSGISVKNNSGDYPAGWHAGYVVDFGADVVTAAAISALTAQTLNDGVLQQTFSAANGLSVSLLSGSTGKIYLNFQTSKAFDEIRLVTSATINALATMRVYYAMAFDANCGTLENNGICYDQIAGPATSVNYNGGLVNALTGLANPGNLIDGNKNTYAALSLPAGVALLTTPPFVAVKDEQRIYPAGTRAGFVINQSGKLLGVNLLGTLSVQTYLHGKLQDNIPYSGGLLQVTGLGAGSKLQEASITTTKPYNEVRLVVAQTASLNVGTINVYYAFESGSGCAANCNTPLVNTTAATDEFRIVDRDRDPSLLGVYNTTSRYGLNLGGSLSNTDRVVNTSVTDFATYQAVVGVAAGARITVERKDGVDYPANTFAGFAISTNGGLLDLGLLNSITIRLYNNDGAKPVQTIDSTSVLNLGLLGGNGINFIGAKANVAFDEMEIDINGGLISAATDFHIYYAYVIRDDDNDGVADCFEVCGTNGNDAIDSDGDGIPDSCDPCNAVGSNKSSVLDTDGDGVVNACDADSDNDGIADIVEDTNGDGNPNNDDADGDGIPNYLDLDSDNDGINDIYESGIPAAQIATLDKDNDGMIDASVPKGSNGMANVLETSDGPKAGNNYPLANTDLNSIPAGDNVPDYLDLDSDNDGINDIVESGHPGIIDANGDGMADGGDLDGDGIRDSADGNKTKFGDANDVAPRDTDKDGIPNYRDLDSDNDGVFDTKESGQGNDVDKDANGVVDGIDSDGDGILDLVDGAPGVYGDANSTNVPDTDGDGIPDYLDLDSDNDGIFDHNERIKVDLDANNDGMVDGTDTDGDGIINVPQLDNNNIFGGGALEALPVKLVGFTALKGNNEVALHWTVAEEINFRQYEVEKSTDAIHFKTIGIVLAAAHDRYNFTDKEPAKGMNYYRLKMVDEDGTFAYSSIQTVRFTEMASARSLVVAPNPVRDQYTLVYEQPQYGMYRFELRSITGQLISMERIQLQGNKQIALWRPSAAASGVYQLTVRNEATGKAETVKLIFK